MSIVFGDSTVRTLVEFLMTASDKVDTGGADMGHVFGSEATVCSRGLHHGAFEDWPRDVLNGNIRSLEAGNPVVLKGRDQMGIG